MTWPYQTPDPPGCAAARCQHQAEPGSLFCKDCQRLGPKMECPGTKCQTPECSSACEYGSVFCIGCLRAMAHGRSPARAAHEATTSTRVDVEKCTSRWCDNPRWLNDPLCGRCRKEIEDRHGGKITVDPAYPTPEAAMAAQKDLFFAPRPTDLPLSAEEVERVIAHGPPLPTKGLKKDQGKLRWSLLPIDATREVVRVLMKGADKYAVGNWAHVENARDRYYDAALRHLTAWYEGERDDPEWGLHHLAHASCCTLFLLALSLRGKIDVACK